MRLNSAMIIGLVFVFGSLTRGFADESLPIHPSADFCPPYAPVTGPMACDPQQIAQELNRLPHPIDWMGRADPEWSKGHSPCLALEDTDQLGRDLRDYSKTGLSYWSIGVFERLRKNLAGFFEKRERLVLNLFSAYVQDPELQSICCKDDGLCKQRFSSVQLRIVDDIVMCPGSGSYDSESHTVRICKNALIVELYDELLERLLLHELGHACDQSIYDAENPINPTRLSPIMPVDLEISHLRSRFGHEFVSCLEAQSQSDPQFHGALSSQPASEAFAEAIFAPRYSSPLHWISLVSYGGYMWADRCLLQVNELRNQVCGSFLSDR